MEHVQIDTSVLTQDALSFLRDQKTDTRTFRMYADRIAFQLLSFALQKEDLVPQPIETPLAPMQTPFLHQQFVFVTVLRAGLAMLPAALRIMPAAPVGFLGLRRDKETAQAEEYYVNIPQITNETTVIVADPMLATGGSMGPYTVKNC